MRFARARSDDVRTVVGLTSSIGIVERKTFERVFIKLA
jgi:hypothetical protein